MGANFKVVIPARYASTRLPGKPLLDIAGKPMVLWVVERAIQSGAEEVIVATDDARIYNAVTDAGYQAVMTRIDHQSGTDRIAEVSQKLAWQSDDVVVNVQGDEPMISPQLIRSVAVKLVDDDTCVMSTASYPLEDASDFVNPNVVKLVIDQQKRALYFSRAPIPYPRSEGLEQAPKGAMRHVGIYGYRVGFLEKYAELKPAAIEQLESLEQLRVLNAGYKIAVYQAEGVPEIGVDTPEDLEKVRKILST